MGNKIYELPVIFCDRIRLTEVFANLVSNAVKFADKQPVVIDIGCERNGIWYEFYVKDNGPGIEERYFEKIFKIVERLEKRGTSEGSGAGLAIVKKVVEMHKGRVGVKSELGKGTTFYFTIPAVKECLLRDMDSEDSARGDRATEDSA
ncbi:MAG: ATP-binding protein [Candidatus Omnitrophica bacterium]|nr:ATP-binding protein [Candidatus Omnitrophota bacterium]